MTSKRLCSELFYFKQAQDRNNISSFQAKKRFIKNLGILRSSFGLLHLNKSLNIVNDNHRRRLGKTMKKTTYRKYRLIYRSTDYETNWKNKWTRQAKRIELKNNKHLSWIFIWTRRKQTQTKCKYCEWTLFLPPSLSPLSYMNDIFMRWYEQCLIPNCSWIRYIRRSWKFYLHVKYNLK